MAYSDIENRFLNSLAELQFPTATPQEMAAEEPSLDGMQLAAGPSATRTDAGPRFGRGGVTRAQSQAAGGLEKPLTALADTGAGFARGAVAQTLGIGGDLESLYNGLKAVFNRPEDQGRLDAFIAGMEANTTLPTTEDISKKLPPVVPAGAADAKSREASANVGQSFGQLAPLPGAIEAGVAGGKAAAKALGPTAASKAQQNFAKKLKNNFDSLVDQYSKIEDTHGGRILNTDDARELSDEYRKNRSLSSSVQDIASNFIERLYSQKLSKPTPEGLDSRVLILGGGGGSGKSSGRKIMGNVADKSEIVYDTTLSNLETAQDKIDKALKAGREVVISYTARDPIESFYGVLERAMRQEKELGTGRTVPLEVFARQHPSARSNIDKLANMYADNPNVDVIGIDNNFGKGGAKLVPVAGIPKFDYNGIEEKLYEILRQEYQAGRISESVYTGTLQNYRPKQHSSQDRSGAVRQPERDGAGARERAQQSDVTPQQVTGGRRAPKSGAQ